MTCTLSLSITGVSICVGLLSLFSSCAIAQGAIERGEYKGLNGVLSVKVPKASNWAGVLRPDSGNTRSAQQRGECFGGGSRLSAFGLFLQPR